MSRKLLIASLVAGAFAVPVAGAQDQTREKAQSQVQERDREQIYGSQLMTRAERTEHRNKLRSLKTAEEREQFRLEHHKKMAERAKARGATLPDEPPMQGKGGGAGPMGGGGPMGPGGGGGGM